MVSYIRIVGVALSAGLGIFLMIDYLIGIVEVAQFIPEGIPFNVNYLNIILLSLIILGGFLMLLNKFFGFLALAPATYLLIDTLDTAISLMNNPLSEWLPLGELINEFILDGILYGVIILGAAIGLLSKDMRRKD